MSRAPGLVVRPSGEAAIVVECGEGIEVEVHQRVVALDAAVHAAEIDGVEETVPAYRSLLVRFDALRTTPEIVADAVLSLSVDPGSSDTRRHEVLVAFAGADAVDLEEVAARCGMSPQAVVAALTGTDLRVYMHGFAPGFAYLGGVPESLRLPRRATPREPVPAGSVLLAAGQAALCPAPMPTGWWVVGRTEHTLFDPTSDPPVPMRAGDTVRLRAVGT